MTALEFLYFFVHSSSKSRDTVDLRFNPAALIVLITQPSINSAIGLLLNLGAQRSPIVPGSEVLYARYDIWTYVAMVLSVLFAWQYFDQRRISILDRYSGVRITRAVRWSLVLIVVLYIFLNFYLYSVSYLVDVLAFGAFLTLGGILSKRLTSGNAERSE